MRDIQSDITGVSITWHWRLVDRLHGILRKRSVKEDMKELTRRGRGEGEVAFHFALKGEEREKLKTRVKSFG